MQPIVVHVQATDGRTLLLIHRTETDEEVWLLHERLKLQLPRSRRPESPPPA
ncbi:MAG: hypothetical protein AB7F35_12470 [Acetobacteraceae bacterium]